MKFVPDKAIEILERTPPVLEALMTGLSDDWARADEGENSWSPFDVLGHLIQGEKTDWIPRMGIILSSASDKHFPVFDRLAQFRESEGKSLQDLLQEFSSLRTRNVETLRSRHLTSSDLAKTGIHPEFGTVTLRQHLATWVVHDLDHLSQISRVMGRQYFREVGPWVSYLHILQTDRQP